MTQDLPEGLRLTNIHECLADAASEPHVKSLEEKPLKAFSFRIREESFAAASEICDRHGTTISEFLRQCCEAIVRDYKA